jgi:hypothetical protein
MKTLYLVLSLCLLCARGSNLSAQSIKIVLLDGKTGKSIPKSWANFWVGKHVSAVPISFDAKGEAILQLHRQDPKDEKISATSDTLRVQLGYAPCWSSNLKTPQFVISPFSIETILKDVIVTQNTCGSNTRVGTPGQLILYVKPLSFWQSMRD